ncbi:MAG: lysylphosphatidylglycerol synthase transmembrane domain-containing protein [Saprospiraceae bacterium]|nr:lysylphosphatidylglycerol synthase transmembrane domain-containing protein [Saprospiraceae bacterium]
MTLPKKVRSFLQFILFTGVGVLILFLVYRSQNAAYIADCALKGIPDEECSLMDKLKADFASVNYWWIMAIIVAFIVSNLLRAHRWLLLIKTMGTNGRMSNAFFTIMVGYFANMGLPRVGELVRAGLFAKYENIGPEKVMGTIVVDRILDLLSLLFAILLAFILQGNVLFAFFENKIGNSVFGKSWLYLLLALVFLLLFFLYRFRRFIKQWSLYQKIHHLVEGFRDGLRSLRRVEKPWLLFLDTVLIWLMYYLMMFLCFYSFEPTAHLGGMAGLMVFVFGGLGIVFPSPGGMGTFHLMVITALTIYGIHGDDAFSFANIQYFSVQLLGCMLIGIIGLIVLPIINKKPKTNVTDPDHGTI